jgi:hypothetical protein
MTTRTVPATLVLLAAVAGLGSWVLYDVVVEQSTPSLMTASAATEQTQSLGAAQAPAGRPQQARIRVHDPAGSTAPRLQADPASGPVVANRSAGAVPGTGTASHSDEPEAPDQPEAPDEPEAPGKTDPPAVPSTDQYAGENHANSSFDLLAHELVQTGRSIAISGFEDHSVSVLGNEQIVTYDDSNVFIARNGQINANSGDTDSSGLNAVDVIGSRIRAGNSGDGEGDEDAAGDDEEEEEVVPAPVLPGSPAGGTGAEQPATTPEAPGQGVESSGSSDDEDASGNDESEEDGIPAFSFPLGGSYSTVTDEGASIATGPSSFVVGADGYDDVSIRTRGDRNIVTYDDSNVVIGGTGKVNAQIGDSDTGGAVVMGILHSDVSAGCEGDLCYPDKAHQPALRAAR